MKEFKLVSEYELKGDQTGAVRSLTTGINKGYRDQTLLGVTGSGKTFTMANVIYRTQRPTLVIAHNKTLAAQLCSEFKEFFPENLVEYFVSYYDYYQPEAYIPSTDTYIEKDSSINEEIDKLRHSATAALFERRDVIIVASVSCIYGLGDPKDYTELMISLRPGMRRDRDDVIRKLVEIQYTRNEINFKRSTFRARGDILEIFPSYSSNDVIRVEFFGDEIDRITTVDPLTGEIKGESSHAAIFPASHYTTTKEKMEGALVTIEEELIERLKYLKDNGKLVEAQRLEQRTRYDMEMMEEVGFCQGIENYSRHLSKRSAGTPPYTLIDYFPSDFLMVIDESHVSIPQIGGMYNGDRSRKESLVEYGFRLPSAFDNRPLRFEEFENKVNQIIYVSATPADYEKNRSVQIVEQIIRPTGLVDPLITVKPVTGQIDDLIGEITATTEKGFRVLVTTLTKRMAEDLTDYLNELNYRVRYLHSDIDTLERMEIIRDLRLGEFDILVGINLLREGLDLPEVALVAILDADKEGFLRSERSLIQTIGRAARNVEGKVIMYADKVTDSMGRAMGETQRRRTIQMEYNREHNITPKTVEKGIRDVIEITKAEKGRGTHRSEDKIDRMVNMDEALGIVGALEKEMRTAAEKLDFERAADLRDRIAQINRFIIEKG